MWCCSVERNDLLFAAIDTLLTLVRNKYRNPGNKSSVKPAWAADSRNVWGTPGALWAKPGSSWTQPCLSCQPARQLGIGHRSTGSNGQRVPHGLADDRQWETAGFLESCFLSCLPPNYLFCRHRWLHSACVSSTITTELPPAGSTGPPALCLPAFHPSLCWAVLERNAEILIRFSTWGD